MAITGETAPFLVRIVTAALVLPPFLFRAHHARVIVGVPVRGSAHGAFHIGAAFAGGTEHVDLALRVIACGPSSFLAIRESAEVALERLGIDVVITKGVA
jgi:hypothetical protein